MTDVELLDLTQGTTPAPAITGDCPMIPGLTPVSEKRGDPPTILAVMLVPDINHMTRDILEMAEAILQQQDSEVDKAKRELKLKTIMKILWN